MANVRFLDEIEDFAMDLLTTRQLNKCWFIVRIFLYFKNKYLTQILSSPIDAFSNIFLTKSDEYGLSSEKMMDWALERATIFQSRVCLQFSLIVSGWYTETPITMCFRMLSNNKWIKILIIFRKHIDDGWGMCSWPTFSPWNTRHFSCFFGQAISHRVKFRAVISRGKNRKSSKYSPVRQTGLDALVPLQMEVVIPSQEMPRYDRASQIRALQIWRDLLWKN